MTAPSWIVEAIDSAWRSAQPGGDGPDPDKLAAALIERLPIQAIAAQLQRERSVDRDASLMAIVRVLTDGDLEVVTLTELYQGACRVLDGAGVPYGSSTPGADPMIYEPLDLAARIRWLVQQRPTRLELQRIADERDGARHANQLLTSVAGERDCARAECDSARAQLQELGAMLTRLAEERDQIQALADEDRVSAIAAADADAARIAELEAAIHQTAAGRLRICDAQDHGHVTAERIAAVRTLLGHEVERADHLQRMASGMADDLDRERKSHQEALGDAAATELRLTQERDAARWADATRAKACEALCDERDRARGERDDFQRHIARIAAELGALARRVPGVEAQRSAPEEP